MAKIDEHVKVMMLKGEPGSSIKSIDKTATSGLTDTYTITLTNGDKQQFNVTNGEQGEGLQSLEIGVRNLIMREKTWKITSNGMTLEHTDGEFRVYGTCDSSVEAFGLANILEKSSLFEPGGTYTFTTYTQLPAGVYIGINTMKKTSSSETSVGILNLRTIGKSVTFTIPGDSTGFCKIYVGIRPSELPEVGKVDVTFRVKLERGSKPSDWTPAPEDKADVATIVTNASVEPTATASDAHAAGDYMMVNGALRKATLAIARGDAISDYNSTDTTVTAEIRKLARTVGETDTWHTLYETAEWSVQYTKRYGVLYIRFHVGALSKNWWLAGNLPEGYRPKMDYYVPAFSYGENACSGAFVGKDGSVSMYSYQTSSVTSSWAIVSIPLW